MIRKETHGIKGALALVLSLACATGLLAGCGQRSADESAAGDGSSVESTSGAWYETDQEAGVLTVRLPVEKEGCVWDFTIGDASVLELVTMEDSDNAYVASFRARGEGETTVSFSYAKEDALEEIRALQVTCKDGKVASVSVASVMPVGEYTSE